MLYQTLPALFILIIFYSIGNIQATKDAATHEESKKPIESSVKGGYLMSMENQWKALNPKKQNFLTISNEELSIHAPIKYVDIVALPLKIDEKKAEYDSKPLLFYYEIKLVHNGGGIQMGFENINSAEYFDQIYHVTKKEVGATFGCGLAFDFNANKFEVFYTKNGKLEGIIQLEKNVLHYLHQIRPYACIYGKGTKIETNFNGDFQYKFEEFALAKKDD